MKEHPELPGYYITPMGEVYSTHTGTMKKKKPTTDKRTGYVSTSIKHPTKGHIGRYYLHQLVAETYLARPSGQAVVNHKDRNKSNNSVSNLEYVSQGYNVLHWRQETTDGYTREVPPLHTNTWWQ